MVMHPHPWRASVKPPKAGLWWGALCCCDTGGHTAEMLRVVEKLDRQRYTPRTYIAADTDTHSISKAVELEKRMTPDVGAAPALPFFSAHTRMCMHHLGFLWLIPYV